MLKSPYEFLTDEEYTWLLERRKRVIAEAEERMHKILAKRAKARHAREKEKKKKRPPF